MEYLGSQEQAPSSHHLQMRLQVGTMRMSHEPTMYQHQSALKHHLMRKKIQMYNHNKANEPTPNSNTIDSVIISTQNDILLAKKF